MTLNQIFETRRSVRKYTNTPVAKETIYEILEAARLAPSGKNRQNWHFTAVTNQDTRQKLEAASLNQTILQQAPLALVVWAKEDRLMTCNQSSASVDCSIALTYMMLKATELGLGSCWLGRFSAEQVKEILGLPPEAVVVGILAAGYYEELPNPRPRKPLEEIVSFIE